MKNKERNKDLYRLGTFVGCTFIFVTLFMIGLLLCNETGMLLCGIGVFVMGFGLCANEND